MGFENTRFMQELNQNGELLDLMLTYFDNYDDFISDIMLIEDMFIEDFLTPDRDYVKNYTYTDVDLYAVTVGKSVILDLYENEDFRYLVNNLGGSTIFLYGDDIYFSDTPIYNIFDSDILLNFSVQTYIDLPYILNKEHFQHFVDDGHLYMKISITSGPELIYRHIILNKNFDNVITYEQFKQILRHFTDIFYNHEHVYLDIYVSQNSNIYGKVIHSIEEYYSEELNSGVITLN